MKNIFLYYIKLIMSNDVFYKFNDKFDESESLKINMDELYQKKQQQDLNVLNNYNKILTRVHNKIKYVSKQLINDQCCWFIVPEMMLGIPKYDNRECTAYIIEKLRENGFIIRYTHPNLLFISWKHWIPTYVRNEIKKKTGNTVDEYGNIVEKNDNNQNNFTSYKDRNILDNNDDLNNMMFNNKNIKEIRTGTGKEKNYKDTKSYKPSGGLIYNNNLLDKLSIND